MLKSTGKDFVAADFITFTEEILNGKLDFFVQCNITNECNKNKT